MTKIEKLARKVALEKINKNRTEVGHPPLRRIVPFWWHLYGKEYMEKAALELAESK
jgi:hypothetical protein